MNCYKDNVSWFLAYNRGAMVATLLDIRLLELSKGSRGLREVVLELYSTHKDYPFQEDSFYDILIQMTYPEIDEFLTLYVKGSDPLPIAAYFSNKLGVDFDKGVRADQTPEQKFLFDRWSVNF